MNISKINVNYNFPHRKWTWELLFKDGTCWTMGMSKNVNKVVEEAQRFQCASGLRLFMSALVKKALNNA